MKTTLFNRTLSALLIILFIFSAFYCLPAAAIDSIEVNSEAALLIEANSQTILYEKNINVKMYPASLTKVMTALLTIENANLDDMVTVTEDALKGLSPFGSTANLLLGEEMSVRDLLYCMLLVSANEACNILAIHVSGSIENFVDMMNERAEALGCKDTHFVNSHGLHDPEHYTTAWDMYLVARQAMTYPIFSEIVNTAQKQLSPTNKTTKGRTLTTTNYLLPQPRQSQYIYRYARGIKTGSTTPAGHCLISCAERDNMALFTVTMKASVDEDTKKIMSFVDTSNLFEWGFNGFAQKTLLKKNQPIKEIRVNLGQNTDHIMAVPAEDIISFVPKDLNPDKDVSYTCELPGELTAPIEKGQIIGKLTLKAGDKVYPEIDLIALTGVERSSFAYFSSLLSEYMRAWWVKITLLLLGIAGIVYIVIMLSKGSKRKKRRSKNGYRL